MAEGILTKGDISTKNPSEYVSLQRCYIDGRSILVPPSLMITSSCLICSPLVKIFTLVTSLY